MRTAYLVVGSSPLKLTRTVGNILLKKEHVCMVIFVLKIVNGKKYQDLDRVTTKAKHTVILHDSME